MVANIDLISIEPDLQVFFFLDDHNDDKPMNVDGRPPHHHHHPDPGPPQLPPPPPPPQNVGGTSRKIGLSCAECRRSKLKCDRIFPCQSCVRRGCAGICPEGTLAATKGNKVLMAHAQRLQEEVKTLTAKVNELQAQLAEAGLKDKSAPRFTPPHMVQGMRSVESHERGENGSASIGSLSIGVNGQAKYHGESAGSEYLQDLLPVRDPSMNAVSNLNFVPQSHDQIMYPDDRHPPDLPPDILDLLHAFPFGVKRSTYSKSLFHPFLPDPDRAVHLSNLYFANIGWMYEPISRGDYNTNILDVIYANGQRSLDHIHSHRVSVFFSILANGAVFDQQEEKTSDLAARTYSALARAAFSLDPILVEATCATVQALFLIVRFIYNADRDRNEERWLITGLNCRLAHMIFWELFTWDAWTGVVNGRPAALAVQHTDCQFPDDLEAVPLPNGQDKDLSWHAWKLRYAANILTASSYHVFNPRTPPYEQLLELDKKIRAFPLPAHLRSPVKNSDAGRSWSPDPSKAMQQYCAICTRESNLLYIHRSYFAQALQQKPDNPLHHKYAASVMATYRAATRLIASLRSLYAVHQSPTGHCWYFWSGIFSSCIVLGALVVESPKCTLAGDALRELQDTIPFFEQGSRACRSQGSVPILEKLLHRAMASYQAGSEVQSPSNDVDELRVLGGRKSVIKPPSRAGSPPNSRTGTPASGAHEEDSPQSHIGAEEMLAEYLGHAPPKYEYESQNPHIYSDEGNFATKSSTMVGSAPGPQGYLRPFISPPGAPGPAMGPDPSMNYHQRSPQSSTMSHPGSEHHPQQQQQPPHQWSSNSYSPPPPHNQQPHAHPPTMMYGHPLDVQPPHAYNPTIRYAPGAPPNRTQEEIWRDFMMGYGHAG
ncbi:hypothetical protein CC1G_12055 [Coprinopsis cinerea okayama7|uniref:Zn(2)-C6 fungal-type domain-containing protein n=1 Tax=Coprinopsis cinerea (strain Okayama-7 / 130 / ATCC MYA-4618 / FGSC 9003) TaxID=240176 RepID=A8N9L7_COPC7|nr:hypothetical protein CC1G_12055 [Coprinopsis cinerea okayama7\|eukprot:XP_001831523.2 hypothetical protein CC1G_12055 [Coprinopsis cinerea okayama7\